MQASRQAGSPISRSSTSKASRIDVYCREQHLDVEARLRLFAQVAGAVAYAHGKLAVHRDLKPANILVSADGQVRLLDFGIAKLLDDGQAKETRFTELSGRALTPDYASPEQIAGRTAHRRFGRLFARRGVVRAARRAAAVQAAARLTRRTRRGHPAGGPAAAERRGGVRTSQRPARRSRHRGAQGAQEEALRALPDGARPARRHRAPSQLAAGARTARQPVVPHKKFIARNTLAVGAAAAIALALIGGAVVAGWQARIALAEKARAEEVQAFIASVFREADPMMQREGKALSAVDLLLQAERRMNERKDATPELKVEMLAIIGESLFGLQENQESARVVEDALRLQQSIPDADPLMTARLHLALSQSREMLGDTDAAVAELAKTFAALDTAKRDAGHLAVRARLHESALGMVDKRLRDNRARRQAGDRRGDGGDRTALRRSRHGVDVSQQGLHLHRPHAASGGTRAPGLGHPAGQPQR